MTKRLFLILIVLSLLLSSTLNAQQKLSAQKEPASVKPQPSEKLNPQMQKIVGEISAKHIEATIRKLVRFGTRHSLSETQSETRGIGAARRWIKSEMDRYAKDSGGRLQVAFDSFVQPAGGRIPKPTEIVNVVATLPGKQAESQDRIYVVSGHYDSCVCEQDMLDGTSDAPGANDDASGTAAVMEMARVMSKYEFDATLVFMTVAAEEQGLLGAAHWAEMAKQKNLNIAGMITNDIIGSSHAEDGHVDDKQVRLFAEGIAPTEKLSPELRTQLQTGGENDGATRQLARYIKEVGEKYVKGFKVNIIYRKDRYLRGGDHSPFLDRGFAAVRMTEPNENYAHQHQKVREENGVKYGDLPEFDDFNYIAQVARVNAAALASMALAPAAPAKVEMETVQLENNTTIRWEANQEPDLAGYRIVWRDTTAPFWTNSIFVGNVTRYTIKNMSKDNYLFGVQAVDQDGNLSVAVYPTPFRPQRR
ncbi:MAG: M20/M25/M40 family metallo-hydrolase [Acidobacteria bacterium]|nr:M20/M25/M40 family metallo-hydrolase [Acidobacteriota bacterium]